MRALKLSTACAASLAWPAHGYISNQSKFITYPMAKSEKPDLDIWLQSVGFTSSRGGGVSQAHVNGHVVKVSNPIDRFSLVPPIPGGCGTIDMVRNTAKKYSKPCVVAADGGYFSLHEENKFACIGSLVADGNLIQTEPMATQNVNFGITEDDQYFIGYITPEEIKQRKFKQLIQGLGWLVHEGKNYVDKGWKEAYTAAGSSGDEYANKTSGRVGLGFDKDGGLILMTFDGHTRRPMSWGITMYELADKMIEMGAVEAVNMDGGGSTTLVHRGTEINYPGDSNTYGIMKGWYDPTCPIGDGKTNFSSFQFIRYVSTILCLHEDYEPDSGISIPVILFAVAGGIALLGLGYVLGRSGRSDKTAEESDTEEGGDKRFIKH